MHSAHDLVGSIWSNYRVRAVIAARDEIQKLSKHTNKLSLTFCIMCKCYLHQICARWRTSREEEREREPYYFCMLVVYHCSVIVVIFFVVVIFSFSLQKIVFILINYTFGTIGLFAHLLAFIKFIYIHKC